MNTFVSVSSEEQMSQTINGKEYTYTRQIVNDVPLIVNLVKVLTVKCKLKIGSKIPTLPKEGELPVTNDFVLFKGAQDHLGGKDKNVVVSMDVYTENCIKHDVSATDTGVRIKSGDEYVDSSKTSFEWETHVVNGTEKIKQDFKDDMCVEYLKFTFTPDGYQEGQYQIKLEFDSADSHDWHKFQVLTTFDIRQADVLSEIGFTSAMTTCGDESCAAEKTVFKLGEHIWAKIILTDMVVDAEDIECTTFKITQLKNGKEMITDLKEKNSDDTYKYDFQAPEGSTTNTQICGAELEAAHFYKSIEGYDTTLESQITITYVNGNQYTQRRILKLPFNDEVNFDAFDDFKESAVGSTEEFDKMEREPDSETLDLKFVIEDMDPTKLMNNFSENVSSQRNLIFIIALLFGGLALFQYSYKSKKDESQAFFLLEEEV